MSVYKKLQQARLALQNTKLTKSGKNKFAGYEYFELGDFLPQIQKICGEIGLCGTVSFTQDTAYLSIYDVDAPGHFTTFTSPMSSASLKGCHEVQNLGAVQTYLRRYLYTSAFEICEHDALDATTGAVEPEKKVDVIKKTSPTENKVETKIVGQSGSWQIIAPSAPVDGDVEGWLDLIKKTSYLLLELCKTEADVMQIFKKNKVLFDAIKDQDTVFFKDMMSKFTDTKNKLIKE